jgi:hypothetical protein
LSVALGAGTEGFVTDHNPDDMSDYTTFSAMPNAYEDVHLGGLLFAHAKAKFKAIELRQYTVDQNSIDRAAFEPGKVSNIFLFNQPH